MNDETRKKLSEISKINSRRLWSDPEFIKKHKEAMNRPEVKKKISESRKKATKNKVYGKGICLICRKEFEKNVHNQKYCKKKCAIYYYNHLPKSIERNRTYQRLHREEINKRAREDLKKNPKKYREKWKRYRDKKRGYSIDFKNIVTECGWCGTEFKPKSEMHPYQKFCDGKCRTAYHNKKFKELSPERVRAIYKKYLQSSKGKFHIFKKNSRKRGLRTKFNFSKFEKILKRDLVCVYCGNEKAIEIEHIIPRIKGGLNESNNLVLACKSCNSSKLDKYLEDWLKSSYCRREGITHETISPVIWDLLEDQKEQRKLGLK